MTSRGEDPKHSTTTTTTPKHPSTTNPYQDEIIQGHGPAIPMTAMNLSYLDFEFFSDEEDVRDNPSPSPSSLLSLYFLLSPLFL